MTEQEFRDAYTAELETMKQRVDATDEDYGWLVSSRDGAIQHCVDNMIAGVKATEHKHDWLGRNPAMKRAAVRCGVRTSPEFRACVAKW